MPETPEVISIRMPSRLELLGVIDRVAQSLCDRMEFDPDTASQVTMAVIEAGTNAIQLTEKATIRQAFETCGLKL